jgi:hypothetical protein
MAIKPIATLLSIFLAVLLSRSSLGSVCPFCSASGQTMRQEMETMDVVGIASLVSASESSTDSFGSFRFEKIVKGSLLITPGFEPEATYFGKPQSKARFLLMGIDPKAFTWSAPLALTKEAEQYVLSLLELPENTQDRLAYFQDYFEHPDIIISRDAYDEFAITSYDDIVAFGPKMKREKLIEWLNDPSISPPRKRLYYTMLGICGKPEDIDWLEKKLVSSNNKDKAGLDALCAAYLMLKGEAGLPLIVETFLKNEDSDYVAIHAVVAALRFHGIEGKRIEGPKVAAAMAELLGRMDLADLVIPELAKLEDWTRLDQLMDMFKKAEKPKAWLIRCPIINFMRACPLPRAQELLEEMEKIDPDSVQRAKTHFPIQKAKPKDTRFRLPARNGQLANVSGELAGHGEGRLQSNSFRKELRVGYLDFEAKAISLSLEPDEILVEREGVNRWGALFVVLLSSLTLGLCMWFVGTGGLR